MSCDKLASDIERACTLILTDIQRIIRKDMWTLKRQNYIIKNHSNKLHIPIKIMRIILFGRGKLQTSKLSQKPEK
jgi:hypothetical protein